jgi:hypothetical protein
VVVETGRIPRWRSLAVTVRSWQSQIRVERVYLVVALVWGVLLVFLTPPLQSFDELAHYYRAWSVAQVELVVPPSGSISLPVGADDLTKRFPYAPIARGEQKVDTHTVWDQLGAPLGSRSVQSSSFAASYGPIGYLPQAVGINVTRVFGGSPLIALYMARLCNLIVAVLLTYFGLRLLPFAKLAVVLVALLPMTMMEMASLSPDALLLGGCIFFSGLVLACVSKASLPRRDMALLAFSAVVLLNAKPGYAVLSLLLLLLVPRQFGSRLEYFLTVFGSIIASGLLALVFLKLASNQTQTLILMMGADNHIDSMQQLKHVLLHPFAFVRAIGATINQLGLFFLRQSVAAYAWGQLNIGDAVMLVAAVGVAAVLAAGERVSFPRWRRAVVLAVACVVFVVVSLGLYMGGTAVGSPAIIGLQGRYFTPCVVLAFVGLAGFPFTRRWLVPAVVGVVILLLIVTNLRTLLLYYY